MGTSLDGTVAALTAIVSECRDRSDRAGYFAAMYCGVTREVRRRAASGAFEAPERMERFVSAFASRYLDAYHARKARADLRASWRVALDASGDWHPLILQHLLLGMNAHINLDLGVTAAEIAPGEQLPTLRPDFETVNDILASLAGRMQDSVSQLSPWIGLLDRCGGRTDETVLGFSIRRARDGAWRTATSLAPLGAAERAASINDLDQRVARLGRLVLRPGYGLASVALIVRVGETAPVDRVIDSLDRVVAE